jgi:hypothetical protein
VWDLWEELGIWPPGESDSGSGDDLPVVDPEDADLEMVAAAEHEGQLDRIAVNIAVLRRRILKSQAGREYSLKRMDLLRKQVAKLEVPRHVKKVLLQYLRHQPDRRGKVK